MGYEELKLRQKFRKNNVEINGVNLLKNQERKFKNCVYFSGISEKHIKILYISTSHVILSWC